MARPLVWSMTVTNSGLALAAWPASQVSKGARSGRGP